jgi:hypothetical protein
MPQKLRDYKITRLRITRLRDYEIRKVAKKFKNTEGVLNFVIS